MILILASQSDLAAQTFADEYLPGRARVVRPADLSTPHWRYGTWKDAENYIVASGQVISQEAVTAVLTLLPGLAPTELAHIVPEDREYVAAEMHAFLFFWLNELECPLLNRPQHGTLTGPAWSVERWRWAAQAAGLSDQHRCDHEGDIIVSVIGDRVVGAEDPILRSGVRRLAAQAGVTILTTFFSHGQLIYAHPIPRLSHPDVARAVSELLNEKSE
jgi:hypothetical protein